MSFPFLTAEWRKLIMAQYEVDPATLLHHLPDGLELDFYPGGSSGRCFVSLVGFLFDRVRILGAAIPLHTSFEEVNLRYYVRRPMPDGTYRRGVVFLSEIVPRPAISAVARSLYGEAYSTAPMQHRWQRIAGSNPSLQVEYEWRHRGLWQQLGVQAAAAPQPIAPGSLEEFITEHYWGYTPRNAGGTSEYAVEHRRWQVYPVRQYRIAANFGSLYGAAFAALTHREPDHILLAEGAPVLIRWGGRIA